MKRLLAGLILGFLAVPSFAVAETQGTGATLDDKKKPPKNPECVSFRAYTVYGAGYDHVVRIENKCTKRARCEVATDVNPNKITTTVDAKKHVDVVTFRGSPASKFTATVLCRLEG